VVAVVRVDAELVDDLEVVFAPVLDVDQGVVQRRAVVAGEAVDAAQGLGSGEDIRRDDLIQQAGELGIGEADAVQGSRISRGSSSPARRGPSGCPGGIRIYGRLTLPAFHQSITLAGLTATAFGCIATLRGACDFGPKVHD
jgi:hypothetical protein